ncbi:MAG TPA: hypothetical protein VFI23_08145 [Rhizomicrobium sp.]|nr:hypothetical protein [Rhizomicrobium sp.]
MLLKVLALISSLAMAGLSCLPAMARPPFPGSQGTLAVVRGIAHIERRALGTYIELENPALTRDVAGYIAFGNEGTFPGLYELDGRNVEISGIVVLDGRALIPMEDPDQLRVAG